MDACRNKSQVTPSTATTTTPPPPPQPTQTYTQSHTLVSCPPDYPKVPKTLDPDHCSPFSLRSQGSPRSRGQLVPCSTQATLSQAKGRLQGAFLSFRLLPALSTKAQRTKPPCLPTATPPFCSCPGASTGPVALHHKLSF